MGILPPDYRGTISETKIGTKCMKWTATEPHKSKYNADKLGVEEAERLGVGDHNYCRNPNNEYEGP